MIHLEELSLQLLDLFSFETQATSQSLFRNKN